ncbi:MAG TPA: hypothetical protein VK466_08515 [Terriglobales bacterium]|nr:hypothetical protein [Terriglobales bacterium]
MLEEWSIQKLKTEWPVIRRSWRAFSLALVAASLLVGLAVLRLSDYRYEKRIEAAEQQRDAANVSVGTLTKLLVGKGEGPTNARLQQEALNVVERLRDLLEDVEERQLEGLRVATAPVVPTFREKEIARFERRYRVSAKVLRDAMLQRLGEHARDDSASPKYDAPLGVAMLKTIAADLERLARMLPTPD